VKQEPRGSVWDAFRGSQASLEGRGKEISSPHHKTPLLQVSGSITRQPAAIRSHRGGRSSFAFFRGSPSAVGNSHDVSGAFARHWRAGASKLPRFAFLAVSQLAAHNCVRRWTIGVVWGRKSLAKFCIYSLKLYWHRKLLKRS
jgi:hypothetical protein